MARAVHPRAHDPLGIRLAGGHVLRPRAQAWYPWRRCAVRPRAPAAGVAHRGVRAPATEWRWAAVVCALLTRTAGGRLGSPLVGEVDDLLLLAGRRALLSVGTNDPTAIGAERRGRRGL